MVKKKKSSGWIKSSIIILYLMVAVWGLEFFRTLSENTNSTMEGVFLAAFLILTFVAHNFYLTKKKQFLGIYLLTVWFGAISASYFVFLVGFLIFAIICSLIILFSKERKNKK